MEKLKFIGKIYTKFIIKYIVISFIIMYLLRYLIVIVQSSIKNNTLHNPFLTTFYTLNDSLDENIKNEYLLTYLDPKTYETKEIFITKKFYENYNDLDFSKNDSYTLTLTNQNQINTKNIKKIEKITSQPSKNNTIINKIDLPLKEIQEKHFNLIQEIYMDLIFNILFLIGLFIYIYKKIKLHNFYLIPYKYNFFQIYGTEQNQKKIYDKFIKKTRNNEFIFENLSKTNYDKYIKERENIKQSLNFENLEIERYKTNQIILKQTNLIKNLDFDKNKLQKNKIYIGFKKGNIDTYLDINGLNHTIIVGEPGSGKSVFIQNLLLSFFYNQENFEKFIMVDPKMVELSRYKIFKKVDYIENMEKVLEMFQNLQKTMYKRLEKMEKEGLVKSNEKFILVLIDEFRTLKNNTLEKKENDLMEKFLIDLIQKSRRTNIRILFRGQKRDTQNISSNVLRNIQTRILLKTKNNDNITKIGGNSEELETYSLTNNDIKNFQKGRGIYKDGDSGEVYLFQSPFFNIQDQNHLNFMFSLLEKKENIEKITNLVVQPPKNENVKIEEEIKNEVIIQETKTNVPKTVEMIEIQELWDKCKTIKSEKTKSEMRKKVQKLKRLFHNQKFEELEKTFEEIKKYFDNPKN